MKLRSLLLVVAAGACSTPQTSTPGTAREPWRALARSLPLKAHAPRVAEFDVEHYALELALEPSTRAITGTCTLRLWPRVEGLARVELDLVGLLASAVRDGDGRQLDFEQDADSLEIRLARPLARDEFAELAVEYAGSPLRGLFFVADRGQGPTQVYTQGECEDARYWFPCYDFPNDRATSELAVTLPPGWTSIAAGTRIDRVELEGGRAREHWTMTTPHPTYLVTLCAGEFAVTESRWQNVPLYFAVAPQLAPLVEQSFAQTDEILTFFSDLTSFRYPYPKYSQTCVDDFRFGGMENISATTLTEACLKDELGLRDGDATGLIAHEAAHQWFGNLMTCADWSHIWLNEGFATYLELLYVEATAGQAVFHERLRGTLEAYLAGDVGPRRRPTVWNVYREPMDLFFDGQAYPGGAMRLHHLRFVLGDEVFFEGLREYVWSNAGRSVTTEDFQRAMERASGLDLEWFFRQWFHSKGYPEFAVTWEWDEDAKEIVLEVRQVQDTADGTPGAFRAPIEIAYGCELGSACFARIEATQRSQTFRVPADDEPLWVEFDPRLRMPRRLELPHALDEAVQMWAVDGEAGVRRSAASELAEIARDVRRDASERASVLWLLAQPEPGRPEALERVATLALAIGAERTFDRPLEPWMDDDLEGAGRAGLAGTQRELFRAELVARSSSPAAGVRSAAWEALVAYLPDDELVVAARREVLETPFSWQTRIQAARLVALADREHARAWLERCLAIPSPQGEFQVGLLGVLGAIEGARALDVFARWLDDESAPSQARQAAARSIGAHGRALKGAREVLERHLDLREFQVTSAVLDALHQLGDAASIPAVRKFLEQPLDARQRRTCERILSANWASG